MSKPRGHPPSQEPSNAQLVDNRERASLQMEQKGPISGQMQLLPKAALLANRASVNPGTSEGAQDARPHSLGGRDQRIQTVAGGSITSQAVILYPILKMSIYNK